MTKELLCRVTIPQIRSVSNWVDWILFVIGCLSLGASNDAGAV